MDTEAFSALEGEVAPTETVSAFEDEGEDAATCHETVDVPLTVPRDWERLPELRVQPEGKLSLAVTPPMLPVTATVSVSLTVCPAVTDDWSEDKERDHVGISFTVIVDEPVAVPGVRLE